MRLPFRRPGLLSKGRQVPDTTQQIRVRICADHGRYDGFYDTDGRAVKLRHPAHSPGHGRSGYGAGYMPDLKNASGSVTSPGRLA